MTEIRPLVVILAFVALAVTEKVSFEDYKVYRLFPSTQEHVALLHKMEEYANGFSFWNEPSYVNKSVDIMVPPGNLPEFTDLMTEFDMKYELYVKNVQRLIDTENPKTRTKIDDGIALNEYHTLDEIYSYLEFLAETYSDVVEVIDAGVTTEGRVIKGIKISYSENNPAIFIEAGIHAREWITPATALYLIDQFLTSSNKTIRAFAEKHDWYIFPSFNPDGYVYTHTNNRMWRKTRSKNGLCIGADANRNWDFKWLATGASNYPCSETYAGSSAFSEPEIKSMAKYIKSIGDKLFAYISFHSYSQLLMFPYGHTTAHLDNYDEELSMGTRAVEALRQRYGTKYRTGNIAETIYAASGTSLDWVKGTLKLPIVFTYEFRDNGRYGFLLPANQIIPNGEEVLDSLLAMFQEASRLGYPDKS